MFLARHDEPTSIGLVESNWTPDSGIVRVFYCDGSTPTTFGFNFVKFQTLSARDILPLLGAQIRRRYGLPPQANIVDWACSAEGGAAYENDRRNSR